jgi:hypothetical protein
MTRNIRLENARIELTARVLEALQDGNLDEGLRSALMKGGLAAGLAAGSLGGGGYKAPVKAPTAVTAPVQKKGTLDRAAGEARGFIKGMEDNNAYIRKLMKQIKDLDDPKYDDELEKGGREMMKKEMKKKQPKK